MNSSSAVQLALLCIFSWGAGLLSYVGATALFYGQGIGFGDLVAAAVWSAIAFSLSFTLVYFPALTGLRRALGGVSPAWAFPLVAVFLGIAPTASILVCWGGGYRSLFSAEASLFYAMFTVVGILVGVGYVRIYRDVTNDAAQ